MAVKDQLSDIRGRVEGIPDRIREIKGDQTTTAFAKFLDVGVSTLHNYENGRIPPIEFLLLLSKKCGVSLTWLITGEGDPYQESRDGAPGARGRILVVDDQDYQRESVCNILEADGYQLYRASNVAEAVRCLEENPCDVVVSDLRMPNEDDGLKLLRHIQQTSPETRTIIVTVHQATARAAVEAIRDGAVDYLVMSPKFPEELSAAVQKAFRETGRGAERAEALPPTDSAAGLRSDAMRSIRQGIQKAARATGLPVLIEGESGTGKQFTARRIHAADPARRECPFIAVRCSALTDAELYVEVFGHPRERGGPAEGERTGIMQTVQGGTVYLADIGETPGRFQVDLLSLLENGGVSFGQGRPIRLAGARIICGTSEPPADLIARGKLRHDLFFRLQVLHMVLPPLRDRREDIPGLAEFLVAEFCREAGRETPRIAPETLRVVEQAEWRENIRELKGVLQKALVSLEGPVLTAASVERALAEVSLVSWSEK